MFKVVKKYFTSYWVVGEIYFLFCKFISNLLSIWKEGLDLAIQFSMINMSKIAKYLANGVAIQELSHRYV